MSEPDPTEKRMSKVERERAAQIESYKASTAFLVAGALREKLDELGRPVDDHVAHLAAAAVLRQSAGRWRTLAELLSEQRVKGWQTVSGHLKEAAGRLVGDAQELEKRAPDPSPIGTEGGQIFGTPVTEPDPELRGATHGSAPTGAEAPADSNGEELGSALVAAVGGIGQVARDAASPVLDYLAGRTDAVPDLSSTEPHNALGIAAREDAMQHGPQYPGAGPGEFDDASAARPVSAPYAIAGVVEPSRVAPPARRDRWTWEQFDAHIADRGPMDHRSHSQLDTYSDCGVKYGMRNLERPAWWSVGGSAFHRFVEDLERAMLRGVPVQMTEAQIWRVWETRFDAMTAEARESSGIEPDEWSAAKKGAEDGDWWRARGMQMCADYVTMRTQADRAEQAAELFARPLLHIRPDGADQTSSPVLELELKTKIGGVDWPFIPDQVRVDDIGSAGRLTVIDLKSGSSTPGPIQLARNAHALVSLFPEWRTVRIDGAYYSARSATIKLYEDVRRFYPLATFEREAREMDRAERAGIYIPRRSSFCLSCGVADLCPAHSE